MIRWVKAVDRTVSSMIAYRGIKTGWKPVKAAKVHGGAFMFHSRMFKARFLLFAPLALVLILAVACGGGEDPTATPPPTIALPTNTPVPADTPVPAEPTNTPAPTATLAPGETPQPTPEPTADNGDSLAYPGSHSYAGAGSCYPQGRRSRLPALRVPEPLVRL